jgi:hypothetical protein
MIGDEVPFPAQSSHPQNGADRALTGGQQRAQQQQLRMPPSPLLHKHRSER